MLSKKRPHNPTFATSHKKAQFYIVAQKMAKIGGSEVWLVIFGVIVSIFLRVTTTLHPYSGEATPPMYGDYEAQRHWMEITTNLPIRDWYRDTIDNNLTYWGLDYPPLTAYHMYLTGFVSRLIDPKWTELTASQGFESPDHKLFMRYTVLATDCLLYIPAIILFYLTTIRDCSKKENRPLSWSLAAILGLLYPGIVLIDHGHFQYNSVSLSLVIFAVIALLHKQNIWASILFTCALNYKQIALYHSIPFFMYLLSTCVPKPGQDARGALIKLLKIGITVIVTFAVIWAPFLLSFDSLRIVFARIFPVDRGVFEDKVSNVWCIVNIFYKLKLRFDNREMMRICLFTTLSAIFPSSIDLFLRPNLKKFVLALINSSLAFFLFSYQVHEKSILFVSIPILLYFAQKPFVCFWFLCVSVFSMLPLLVKDGLGLATLALMLFYVVSFRICIEYYYRSALNVRDSFGEYYRSLLHLLLKIECRKKRQHGDGRMEDLLGEMWQEMVKNGFSLANVLFHFLWVLSLAGCVLISMVAIVFEPPERYPDLWALAISAYSAVHFFAFFLYFNWQQIQIGQEFDDIKNVKLKVN